MAFNDIMQPTQAQPQELPPQELQTRASGWMDFLARLRNDPAMRSASMNTAAQLAQGPGAGQSTLGHLTQSLQGGVMTYDMQRANQEKQRREEAERVSRAGREERELGLRESAGARQDREAAAREGRESLEAPLRRQKLERDIAGSPEKDAAEIALRGAQTEEARARAKAALRPPKEPVSAAQMARDVFVDTWSQSSEGKKVAEGQRKQAALDAYLERQKDANAGVLVQTAQTLLNSQGEEDQKLGMELMRNLAKERGRLPQQPAPGTREELIPRNSLSLEEGRAGGGQVVTGKVRRKVKTAEELAALPVGTLFDFNGRTGIIK